MDKLLALLSGRNGSHRIEDLLLLLLRLAIGGAMLTHGVGKIMNFSELAPTFIDPLGIGSTPSLVLAMLAEVLGSIALMLGVLTRVSALVLLFTMGTATYAVGMLKGWAGAELAFIYSLVYLTLMVQGGGRIGLEHFWLSKRRKAKALAKEKTA
ncbi:DoxX family protein [Photobacterium lutimaris]|uniref:DoxX family protein n=1 Tax=Photobacterium lutimaris TaxID=388278 RepID=A0A2T3IW67_9GAMM|nr:DoxX family protein [Photobacterium lutimaris]PSU32695.1 DoxX family protein [Photobacterium lutimaris]TDR74301.1 putative oxidoreductase [Photobacterium lutimaris]